MVSPHHKNNLEPLGPQGPQLFSMSMTFSLLFSVVKLGPLTCLSEPKENQYIVWRRCLLQVKRNCTTRLLPLALVTGGGGGAGTPRTTEKVAVEGKPTKLGFPNKLNHYWCYQVSGEPVNREVILADQFRTDTVRVEQPVLFCNPVTKVRDGKTTRIEERNVHLTCYDLHGPQRTEATRVTVSNQFEKDIFTITFFEPLCVPSEKETP
jgi:hypothetical protein